jgi:integrase
MKLTTANIALPEGKNDLIVFDNTLVGFGLRVRRLSGGIVRRNWIIQYKQHGHQRRMIIASAEKVTAAQAREKARKLLAAVELGTDPQADKKKRREADQMTLRHVIDEFISHKSNVKPRTLTTLKRYLDGPLYIRSLHSMPVDKITRRDLATKLLAVAKANGTPTAIALRGALSTLFVWSMEVGLIEHNPLVGAHRPAKPPARDRVLDDDELVAVWKGVEGDGDYAAVIRLIICCGARRDEVGGMRWDEFSPDMDRWTLPKERNKSHKANSLPVTPLMRSIIEAVPIREGNDCLFGAHGFTAFSVHKKALDARLDLKPWVVHDLRRSVSTRMNDLGIAPHVVEKILGHTLGGSHGIYNRSDYSREVRAAMAVWSDHLESLLDGTARKVVAFPQATA